MKNDMTTVFGLSVFAAKINASEGYILRLNVGDKANTFLNNFHPKVEILSGMSNYLTNLAQSPEQLGFRIEFEAGLILKAPLRSSFQTKRSSTLKRERLAWVIARKYFEAEREKTD